MWIHNVRILILAMVAGQLSCPMNPQLPLIRLLYCTIEGANRLTYKVKEAQTRKANEKSKVSTNGRYHVSQVISLQLLLPEESLMKLNHVIMSSELTVQIFSAS